MVQQLAMQAAVFVDGALRNFGGVARRWAAALAHGCPPLAAVSCSVGAMRVIALADT